LLKETKKVGESNSKDSSGGHFKTLSPRAVTDLGGERLEGLPHARCLRRVSPDHGDDVVAFVILQRVMQRQRPSGRCLEQEMHVSFVMQGEAEASRAS
jgi:hypothetical protein